MFKLNERETGGNNANYYPEGIRTHDINLKDDEFIYGCFRSIKRTYYFTSTSLVICNGNQERIIINEISGTNGSFRSDHNLIYIETLDGKSHKINISEFPYRLQQLLYQLIEKHGSLIHKPLFNGPTRLKNIATDLTEKDFSQFGFSIEPKTIYKSIKTKLLLYYGNLRDNLIYPDEDGILILKAKNDQDEIEIFNSSIDGYNGVAEITAGRFLRTAKDFIIFDKSIERLILKFNYSIEDYEFEDLIREMNLKSKEEVNNLFGSIEVYAENNGRIDLITEFETQ